jgi:hypothetical protein
MGQLNITKFKKSSRSFAEGSHMKFVAEPTTVIVL